MKKKFLVTSLLLLSVQLAACGGKETDDNTTKNESTETASVSDATSGEAVEEATETSAVVPAPVTIEGRPEEQGDMTPQHQYTLADVHEVDGRQGVACGDGCFYISGSTTLTKYDENWEKVSEAEDPFKGFDKEVNHIGDIDVYDGKIYAGVEYFMDGESKNIQIAVYDAETFQLNETFMFAEDSGQTECSGIAVDPDSNSIWMTSWVGDESGRYLYQYDLESGAYKGKVHLQCPPQWLQGIAYYDGSLYMTADDGTADVGEPDHVYRTKIEEGSTTATVVLERTLDDVTLQGEIEGISFDKTSGQMLISYNRGSQIVLGMVKGYYEGYTEEIHEVFVYDISDAENGAEKKIKYEDLFTEDVDDVTGWNLILVNENSWKTIDYN